ncbi:dienelactone hydrolase family protein [Flammeovirga yaeyamensis]|uniref:Dienelactone hydrolase family protein n=1 Tax=Flammeovirga yaeyamensis TaxID=367791 RepID=A0AAX1NDD8_9BACT|nr:prolyl oligopeptidase family serine peptidase [Flammeovirga yaeyamensis]MBB3696523.1 dienelactone hydrolase [Flammeovirga yaeyamensis]NMF33203.1 prolyl oligopeptidase family serine peptidase [Flammeovirga yaeyamensis]QWG05517.1 dienelactone hydrolase family protein [Flammeovirga yaeyamensis]
MKYFITFFLLLTTVFLPLSYAQNPQELWGNFDPDAGDFNEEIIYEHTDANGIYEKHTYISAYFKGKEIRVYCEFKKKADATNAPALLDVHGWMARPRPNQEFVEDGWAVLAHDYCGKTEENNSSDLRANYTKYPEGLEYGNMNPDYGYENRKSKYKDSGEQISDPTETDDYLWYVLQRRALSYLLAQDGVDNTRVGAQGYSYGGTIMWNLAMDERIDAMVAYFGVGFLEYYRTKQVWMYNNPYNEPAKTSGEEMYLESIAPQAHAPYIKAASLWLNGSNDHHGGHERGETMFDNFQADVPWNFAIQPKAFHATDKLGDDAKIWLEKHVLGVDHYFPARPTSSITLDAEGVPFYSVSPAQPENVTAVEVWYALKNPNNNTRTWIEAPSTKDGNNWTASLPVSNIDDYVFGFSKIDYDNNTVISGDFEAEIPSNLGDAKATLEPEAPDPTDWENAGGAIEVPGGVEAFYPVENKPISNDIFKEPFYKAPQGASFKIRYYGTQPQKLFVRVNEKYVFNFETGAHNTDVQEINIPASALRNSNDANDIMGEWSVADLIEVGPEDGQEITKVAFVALEWGEEDVMPNQVVYQFDGTEDRILAQNHNITTEVIANPSSEGMPDQDQVTKVTRQNTEEASIILPLGGEIQIGSNNEVSLYLYQEEGAVPTSNDLTLTLRNNTTGVHISQTLPISTHGQWGEYVFDFDGELNSDGSAVYNRIYSEMTLSFGTNSENIEGVVYYVSNIYGPEVSFEGTNTRLKELRVNNIKLADFDPSILRYTIDLPYGSLEVPTITAAVEDPEATYEIMEAGNVYKETVVRVTAKNGYTQRDYRIRFNAPGRKIFDANNKHAVDFQWRLVRSDTATVENPVPDHVVGEGVKVLKVTRNQNADATVEFIFKDGSWLAGEDKLFRIQVLQKSGQEDYPAGNRIGFYAGWEKTDGFDRGTFQNIEVQDQWIEYTFDLNDNNVEVGNDFRKVLVYFGNGSTLPGTEYYLALVEGPSISYNYDANLKSIHVDGELLTTFHPDELSYTIELPYGTTGQLPTIEGTANSMLSTVEVSTIADYTEEQTITVTAENGTQKVYSINYVETALSTNALLSDLIVDGATIDGFDPNKEDYAIELPYGSNISDLPEIIALTQDEYATVDIQNATTLPGEATITVTAQDTNVTKVYKISFTVSKNTDATLKSLGYNSMQIENFNPSNYTYSVEFPYDFEGVPTIEAALSDENAMMTITNITEIPGTATVKVVAEDAKTTLTYSVQFSLGDIPISDDASLSSLKYNGTSIENFTSDQFSYTVALPLEYEGLPLLEAVASDEKAVVKITDVTTLPAVALVEIMAEDGVTELVYMVAFSKEDAPLSIGDNPTNIKVFKSTSNTITVTSDELLNGKTLLAFDLSGRIILKQSLKDKRQDFNITNNGLMIIHIIDNKEALIFKLF